MRPIMALLPHHELRDQSLEQIKTSHPVILSYICLGVQLQLLSCSHNGQFASHADLRPHTEYRVHFQYKEYLSGYRDFRYENKTVVILFDPYIFIKQLDLCVSKMILSSLFSDIWMVIAHWVLAKFHNKDHFPGLVISNIKMRQLWDCVIFIKRIPTMARQHFIYFYMWALYFVYERVPRVIFLQHHIMWWWSRPMREYFTYVTYFPIG